MTKAGIAGIIAGCLMLAGGALTVQSSVGSAAERLKTGATEGKPKGAIANDAEAKYCTPAFKTVLDRVLHACGLMGSESRRGCQPADVKTLASISDEDFNALFT